MTLPVIALTIACVSLGVALCERRILRWFIRHDERKDAERHRREDEREAA
jgi:hypothetical protein